MWKAEILWGGGRPGRTAVRATAAVLLVASFQGCGASDAARDGATVRDSAGIRIVENGAAKQAAGSCSFDAEPEVEIGEVEGAPEYQLFRVADATRLEDGGIALVNSGTHEVRLYDRNGRHRRTFGGEGDGPEEFRFPAEIWQRGDSLVVYDAGHQRLGWFSLDASLLREAHLRPAYANGPLLHLLGDGRIVAADRVFDRPGSGFRGQPLYLTLHRPDGEVADTLGQYIWRRMGQVGPPGGRIVTSPIFDPRTFVAASRDRVFIATGDDPEIEVLSPEGDVIELLRWSAGDREVTEHDVERFREAELAEAETPDERAVIRQRLDERPVGERFPALDRLLVDRVGRVWVREYRRPGEEDVHRWLVFDRTGALRCRIRLDARHVLLEAGADHVLVRWHDAFDVEHVRMHRLSVEGENRAG